MHDHSWICILVACLKCSILHLQRLLPLSAILTLFEACKFECWLDMSCLVLISPFFNVSTFIDCALAAPMTSNGEERPVLSGLKRCPRS